MKGPLRITRSVVIPEGELRWRFSRSSGPGGQSVNTADSRVELSLDVARTTALGPTQRARALTRLAARLATLLRAAIAPPPPARKPTRATRAATERRLAAKRRRARTKRLRRTDDED